MGTIHVVATFPSIDPAKLNEFKKVAAQTIEIAKREEATLQYEYFMSADEPACVLLETYASSEALLAHMAGILPVVQRLVELGGEVKVDVFGDPSPALVEAMVAFKPKIYASIGGK
jgi:quinol monooxygenase YgiN